MKALPQYRAPPSGMEEENMTDEIKGRAAEAVLLSRTASAFMSRTTGKPIRVKVKWLDNNHDLGYTDGNTRTIHVAWDFKPYTKVMTDEEKRMFRFGVFAHELLHQALTNFAVFYAKLEEFDRFEASIYSENFNCIEDPSIEYQADSVIGGYLLKALRFSIRVIYMGSPEITDSPTAYAQFLNALIQFGDLGVVKGKFTFPEAEEAFKKAAPIYNKCIECTDSKKRTDYALEVMEIARPLWERDLEDEKERQKLMDELKKALQQAMDPSSTGEDQDDQERSEDSEGESEPSRPKTGAQKRRESLVKKLLQEASENGGNDDTSDDANSNGQNASATSDKEEAKPGSSSSANGDREKAGSSDADSSKSSSSSESSSKKDKGGEAPESYSNDGKVGGDGNGDAPDAGSLTLSKEEVEKLLSDDNSENYTLSKEEKEQLDNALDNASKQIEKEERKNYEDQPQDFDVHGAGLENAATCSNLKAESREDLVPLYNSIVNANRGKIKHLVRSLEQCFAADQEEVRRATTGAYDILRGSVGTSAKIFNKRKDPGSKRDCEVFLLVDQSGSMYGSKISRARETAIIFAEALMQMGIPHYVMGFTADEGPTDALHLHYVTWNSTKQQLTSLAGMRAIADNFDSYSIRYAGETLEKRAAKNKLLVIISDGAPAARAYRSYNEGLELTTRAIAAVQKKASVLGIAIGQCEADVLQKMYGRNFIHTEEEGLSNLLIKRLGKIVEKEFK